MAGMARIATNVLHNVGNVLNSVNVSAALVLSRVRASKIAGLARAVQLMEEHSDDLGAFLASDPKGKVFPGYLRQLAAALVAEQNDAIKELSALGKNVEHIKEIIAAQQAYAGGSRLLEKVQIGDLVEQALRINEEALARRRMVVSQEIAPVPELLLDHGRILQILVNLIGNAEQAMEDVTDREPRLTVGVELLPGERLRICVADNGVGIATQALTQVFAHGFTTKKAGHGFGLHSALIAAHEMGGTLTAHSEGPGTGAAFTLDLPVETADVLGDA
jgi:C4-dicarboxylate-specific signal transduction histidine kinase